MLEAINRKQAYGENGALKGLDPQVNSADIYSLLGADGAGKTATINLLQALRYAAGRLCKTPAVLLCSARPNNQQTINR